ncbi:MAG: protein kinase [Sandaracinaceae bacterium]|nr:protein kinase [Sandaracinaceae bacterium]
MVDFGIAKFKEDDNHKLTQTGQAMGTPYYMSPEQIAGQKDVDERTDIYALGVILFHALTAAFPFHAESFPMLVVQICQAPRRASARCARTSRSRSRPSSSACSPRPRRSATRRRRR